MLTFSEQGLYFFLGRSDKPAALPMQMWIAGEVLPSIRKTGSYSVAPAPANPYAVMDRRGLLALALEQEDTILERGKMIGDKDAAIGLLVPKAEFHDRVAACDDSITLLEFGAALGVGRNRPLPDSE